MPDKRELILDRAINRGGIPSLSPLALRLVELAADANASAADLVVVIEKDPGLTARLLRMVNSPFYSRGAGEVGAVSRAVVLLGFEEIRFMALSMSLKNTLPVSTFGPDYHLFWRTSVHRAVLARQTAQAVGQDNPEEAFTAGLIQEIGLPMLLMVLDPDDLEGFPGFHVSCEDQAAWEIDRHGIGHRELGQAALASWGLPQPLVACQQIAPQEADAGFAPLLLLADFARRAAESFFAPGVELTDVHRIGMRRFSLGDDQVNQLLTGSLIDAGEIADALDVEMDFQGDVSRVLDKASQALSLLKEDLRSRIHRLAGKGQGAKALGNLEPVIAPLDSVGGLVENLAGQLAQDGPLPDQAAACLNEVARLRRVVADIEVLTRRAASRQV